MLPALVSIIKRYSCHINPGLELVNTYYYEDGLWHRITGVPCYNWRVPVPKSNWRKWVGYHSIHSVNRLGKYKSTGHRIPRRMAHDLVKNDIHVINNIVNEILENEL